MPAPIVNAPNIGTLLKEHLRLPLLIQALFPTAKIFRFIDSTPEMESNHTSISDWLPPLTTNILRSYADAARTSPSLG